MEIGTIERRIIRVRVISREQRPSDPQAQRTGRQPEHQRREHVSGQVDHTAATQQLDRLQGKRGERGEAAQHIIIMTAETGAPIRCGDLPADAQMTDIDKPALRMGFCHLPVEKFILCKIKIWGVDFYE